MKEKPSHPHSNIRSLADMRARKRAAPEQEHSRLNAPSASSESAETPPFDSFIDLVEHLSGLQGPGAYDPKRVEIARSGLNAHPLVSLLHLAAASRAEWSSRPIRSHAIAESICDEIAQQRRRGVDFSEDVVTTVRRYDARFRPQLRGTPIEDARTMSRIDSSRQPIIAKARQVLAKTMENPSFKKDLVDTVRAQFNFDGESEASLAETLMGYDLTKPLPNVLSAASAAYAYLEKVGEEA